MDRKGVGAIVGPATLAILERNRYTDSVERRRSAAFVRKRRGPRKVRKRSRREARNRGRDRRSRAAAFRPGYIPAAAPRRAAGREGAAHAPGIVGGADHPHAGRRRGGR